MDAERPTGWWHRELYRFRYRNRDVVVKRKHGVGALLLVALIALVVGLAVGFAGGYHYPYRTLPRPPVPPGQKAPPSNCSHTMGGCLPRPKVSNAASITATQQGPDLSNNDPVYSASSWAAIARHSAFAIFKVNESTSYVDRTAAPMAAQAKRHGLVVGGYDFLHVCGPAPGSEARVFVAALRADGLTGSGTLPGTGDAEYGGSGCNVRDWIGSWASTVYNLTGRWPMFYTGAWWWQPHAGAYWPNPSLAWISGYGVRWPYLPSGRSHLDIWQFADNGWNGATSADLSRWYDGAAAFTRLVGGKPAPPVDKYRVLDKTRRSLGHGIVASERGTITTWDRKGCRHPARRGFCVSSRNHARLLVRRIDRVSCHTAPAGFGVSGCNYRPANRRARRAWLARVGAS